MHGLRVEEDLETNGAPKAQRRVTLRLGVEWSAWEWELPCGRIQMVVDTLQHKVRSETGKSTLKLGHGLRELRLRSAVGLYYQLGATLTHPLSLFLCMKPPRPCDPKSETSGMRPFEARAI